MDSLPALPFLRGIPDGLDTLFHLFRAVQLDELIGNGIVFSRWAPDLVYGYGYPLFNYYAPLSYYLVELFHLFGLSVSLAFVATFVTGFISASVFMYLWVRDIAGGTAGLVAATAYAFAPYMMITSLQRGALAEQLSLALLPLCLWAFLRLSILDQRRYATLSTLSYSAIIVTHNITALIFTPVLMGYIVLLGYLKSKASGDRHRAFSINIAKGFVLILFGIGLTAFYWVPALMERGLVQIYQAYVPRVFNFDANFLTIGDVFALPNATDPSLINQGFPISLSLVALSVGLLVLLGPRRLRSRDKQRAHIVYATLVISGCIFMSTSLSSTLWEKLPLLRFLQFPWRFVGIASLFLALLSGIGASILVTLIPRERLRLLVPSALILMSAGVQHLLAVRGLPPIHVISYGR